MKLHAARALDLQDAARLARDTNITDPDHLLALVADAYGADAVTAETEDFAHHALSLAQYETHNHHRSPPDHELGAEL